MAGCPHSNSSLLEAPCSPSPGPTPTQVALVVLRSVSGPGSSPAAAQHLPCVGWFGTGHADHLHPTNQGHPVAGAPVSTAGSLDSWLRGFTHPLRARRQARPIRLTPLHVAVLLPRAGFMSSSASQVICHSCHPKGPPSKESHCQCLRWEVTRPKRCSGKRDL